MAVKVPCGYAGVRGDLEAPNETERQRPESLHFQAWKMCLGFSLKDTLKNGQRLSGLCPKQYYLNND